MATSRTGTREHKLRAARLRRECDGICALCNEPIDMQAKWPAPQSFTVDHIVPVSMGGTNDPSNLQAAHALCNSTRQNKTIAKSAHAGLPDDRGGVWVQVGDALRRKVHQREWPDGPSMYVD